jgi:hypothetical protein
MEAQGVRLHYPKIFFLKFIFVRGIVLIQTVFLPALGPGMGIVAIPLYAALLEGFSPRIRSRRDLMIRKGEKWTQKKIIRKVWRLWSIL